MNEVSGEAELSFGNARRALLSYNSVCVYVYLLKSLCVYENCEMECTVALYIFFSIINV